MGLSGRGRWMVLEALTTLAIARVWLLIRPFQRVARRLGTAVAPDSAESFTHRTLSDQEAATAREVSVAVRWVARFTPFRAVCIQQAVAAKLMLDRRRIPSIMCFGVARSVTNGKIKLAAHAWLKAGGVDVTGFDVAADFQEIARFV